MEDPDDPPRIVPDDPNDDYLVALALATDCDALVTRDRHFEKVKVSGLRIIGPRDALRLILDETAGSMPDLQVRSRDEWDRSNG